MTTASPVPLITRRRFAQGFALGGAALALSPAVFAHAARVQAATDLASLGFPELKITVTDTGFEGVPAETPAGRYLLSLTGKTTESGALAFLSPTPAGMSAADFLQAMSGPPAEASPAADGTPPASGDQGGDQQIPLVFYQFKFAGGATVDPGTSAQSVIDLTAGEWLAWGDDPSAKQQPVVFKVTGDFPKDVKDPEADTAATLIDFAISFEGKPTAGKHLLKIQNHGSEPHFLLIMKGPDSMNKERVEASLKSDMTGTPQPGALSDDELQPIFMSLTQSSGTVTWHPVEIQAGTYLAICFFPTAGTGVPHAMNGMYEIFRIS